MAKYKEVSKRQANRGPIVIGIPAYAHTCDDILGKQASAIPNSYIDALVRVGASPLIIPIVNDRRILRHLIGMVDGLMLIGGPDIDPVHYAQTAQPGLRQVTPDRDKLELTLIRWAMAVKIPLFGICRGMQVLNVAAGGNLWQDIAGQVPQAQKHDQYPDFQENHLAHAVQIVPGSRIAGICRQTQLAVNSLHHQAIDRVGAGLRVVARSGDGIIEAVEGNGEQWIVGVQWHPEWLVEGFDEMQALFGAFRDACRPGSSKAIGRP
ncbi:MAG: gamma-glutamyl-gamma-aminobutyrate hydrolase family protein [Desulfosarcina sp.]|nr:gamma-glutamyl-gamma-aminobutyrate hydrolase family protein [Desulfobacterales bacterium]